MGAVDDQIARRIDPASAGADERRANCVCRCSYVQLLGTSDNRRKSSAKPKVRAFGARTSMRHLRWSSPDSISLLLLLPRVQLLRRLFKFSPFALVVFAQQI